MFHVTSSLLGALAAVTAWVLVAQPSDKAKANVGVDYEQLVNRVAKADRIAAPRTNIGGGRVLFQPDPLTNVTVISQGLARPQVAVRKVSRSTAVPALAPHNHGAAPAIPVGCDPVAAPYVDPALARVIGRCLS